MQIPADDPRVVALVADIRARIIPAIGGTAEFLADPGGQLDLFDNARPEHGYSDEDHIVAAAAIAVIEQSAVDEETNAATAALAAAGITDAYLMNPGPGTVHVPFADGTVFLSDPDGGLPGTGTPGYVVGVSFDDGSEEVVLHRGEDRAEALRAFVADVQRLREFTDSAAGTRRRMPDHTTPTH